MLRPSGERGKMGVYQEHTTKYFHPHTVCTAAFDTKETVTNHLVNVQFSAFTAGGIEADEWLVFIRLLTLAAISA